MIRPNLALAALLISPLAAPMALAAEWFAEAPQLQSIVFAVAQYWDEKLLGLAGPDREVPPGTPLR